MVPELEAARAETEPEVAPVAAQPAPAPAPAAPDLAAEIAFFEKEAALAGATPAAARLLNHVGHLLADRKKDRAAAAQVYSRAFKLDPKYRPILDGARALYADAGQWPAVVQICETELKLSTDPAARVELLRLLAALAARRLGKRDAAAAWLRQAFELAPDHPSLLVRALEEARLAGDAAREIELCQRAAAGTRDERLKARYLARSARLLEARGDAEGARTARRQLLALAPVDLEAQAAVLPELLAAGDVPALEKIARAEVENSSGSTSRYRLARLVALKKGALDEGLELLKTAREINPRDQLALEALAEIAERKDPAAAEPHLQARLDTARDPLEKAFAALRLARLAEKQGRLEEALGHYAALAALAPAVQEAARAPKRLAGGPDADDPAARLAEELAKAEEPHQKADICWKLGSDADERLGDVDKAAGFYLDALGFNPGHLAARNSLVRLYDRAGRFQDLSQFYEKEYLIAQSEDQKHQALVEMAEVLETRLGDATSAIAAYRMALDLKPDAATARSLCRCAVVAGKPRDLVHGLEKEADCSADAPRQQIALLHRAAEVYARELNQAAKAQKAWERIRAIDGAYAPALRALEKLYEAAGNAEGLASLRAASPKAADPAQALADAEEAARAAAAAGDWERAAAALADVVGLAPEHPTAWSDLARVQGLRGDEAARAEALGKVAALVKEPLARADALFRFAEACEAAGDAARAELACDEAVKQAPRHAASWRLLSRLRLSRGDAAGAAAALEQEVAVSQLKDRVTAQKRLATLLADRLGRADKALEILKELFDLDNSDVGAVSELERLYRETGDLARSAEFRGRLAAKCADMRAAAALRAWAAADRAAAGDEEGAINEFRRALALDNANREATEEVMRWLRAKGDAAALGDMYQRLVPTVDRDARAWLTYLRGEIYEDQGNDELALRTYRDAANADGTLVAAIRAARRLHEKRGELDEVRILTAQEGEVLHDKAAGTALLLHAAELAEKKGDPEQAVSDYMKVLARVPGEPRALARLDALHRAAGQFAELVDLYEKQAEASKDDAPRHAALYAEAGWLRYEKLGEDRRAAIPMNRALAKDPACARALEMKAAMALKDGRADEAEAALAAAIAGNPPAAVKVQMLSRLAEARLGLGKNDEAWQAAKEAARLAPDSPDAQELLVKAAMAANALDDAEAAAEQLLSGAHDFVSKARFARLAASLKAKLGDVAGSSALYRRALELLPGDKEALEALEKVHADAKDWEGLANAYETLAAAAEPKLAARYRERAAHVWADLADEPARAVEVYRNALEGAPDDTALRLMLARTLARVPAFSFQALAELRTVSAKDAANPDAWREMAAIFGLLGMPDGAFLARAAVVALGQAQGAEPGAHQMALARLPGGWGAALSPEDAELLVHPIERSSPVRDVMNAIGAELPKAFAVSLDDRGYARADRVRGDVRTMFDRLAQLLGVPGAELYQSTREPTLLGIENTDPPTVVVGAQIFQLGLRELVFALAMLLSRIRMRTHVAVHAVPIEMANLVAESLRQVDPAFARFGQRNDELGRRIGKALSRAGRKGLEAALPRFSGPVNFAAYVQAMTHTSHRFGLMAAGDPAAAVNVLMAAGKPGQAPGERPDVRELLAFAVSDECLNLRQKLKIAVG